MTTKPLPERPDMKRVLTCAKSILSRVKHGLPDKAIMEKLEEILFWRKETWESARLGQLSEEETANLVLAHLDTMVEGSGGMRFHTEGHDTNDTHAMRRALFGAPTKS